MAPEHRIRSTVATPVAVPLAVPTRIAAREVVARDLVLVDVLTVEYFSLDEDIYTFERLLLDRLRPKDGMIPLRERAGVGLELDRAAVARYRIG